MDEWKINKCKQLSSICNYWCCHQCKKIIDNSPENSLILFPGEVDNLNSKYISHIEIKEENFNWWKLWYCKREYFYQSNCSLDVNYKPFDCQSYPFFPTIINWKLELMIDSKCPLFQEIESLKEHYLYIYNMWSNLIKENNKITSWLSSFELEWYKIYSVN